jgi:hypothetical protein
MTAAANRFAHRAWVAFTGKTEIAWLRLLRPGFRHCFVVFHDGRRWLHLDPLANYTDLAVHDLPPDFDLTAWLRREAGCRVVPAPIDRSRKTPAPLAPFTCVEAVKRALGLHDRWIFTPWQLYRRLTFRRKHHGKS